MCQCLRRVIAGDTTNSGDAKSQGGSSTRYPSLPILEESNKGGVIVIYSSSQGWYPFAQVLEDAPDL